MVHDDSWKKLFARSRPKITGAELRQKFFWNRFDENQTMSVAWAGEAGANWLDQAGETLRNRFRNQLASTPLEIIQELNPPDWLLEMFAFEGPSANLEDDVESIFDEPTETRSELARAADADEETLALLIGDLSLGVRSFARMNPALSSEQKQEYNLVLHVALTCEDPEVLAELATDPRPYTRQCIARNFSPANSGTLDLLSTDTEKDVLFAIARNPAARPETLERVFRSTDEWKVLGGLASNPNIPDSVMNELVKLFPENIINLPQLTQQAFESLAKLHSMTDRLLERRDTPKDVLASLSVICTDLQRAKMAALPDLPEDLLNKLALDPSPKVRMAVALNPCTALDLSDSLISQLLAEDEEWNLVYLGKNPLTPCHGLEQIGSVLQARILRRQFKRLLGREPAAKLDELKAFARRLPPASVCRRSFADSEPDRQEILSIWKSFKETLPEALLKEIKHFAAAAWTETNLEGGVPIEEYAVLAGDPEAFEFFGFLLGLESPRTPDDYFSSWIYTLILGNPALPLCMRDHAREHLKPTEGANMLLAESIATNTTFDESIRWAQLDALVEKRVMTANSLLHREFLPEDLIEKLIATTPHFHKALASHPSTPEHILEQLADDPSCRYFDALLANRNLPQSVLEKIYEESPRLRESVLSHINFPCHRRLELQTLEAIQYELASDWFCTFELSDPEERSEVVESWSVDTAMHLAALSAFGDLAEYLVKRKEALVRRALACNEKLADATVQALAKDDDLEVRKTIAKTFPASNQAVCQMLVMDADADVRECLAPRSELPIKLLEILALDISYDVRRSLLNNSNLSGNVVAFLSQTLGLDSSIHRAMPTYALDQVLVALRSSYPVGLDTLKQFLSNLDYYSAMTWQNYEVLLALKNANVDYEVASCKSCPPKYLLALANNANECVRFRVSQNRALPAALLEACVTYEPWTTSTYACATALEASRRAELNRKARTALLTHEHPAIRSAYGARGDLERDEIVALAKDPEPLVRLSYLRLPNTELRDLKEATQDEDWAVSFVARLILSQRETQVSFIAAKSARDSRSSSLLLETLRSIHQSELPASDKLRMLFFSQDEYLRFLGTACTRQASPSQQMTALSSIWTTRFALAMNCAERQNFANTVADKKLETRLLEDDNCFVRSAAQTSLNSQGTSDAEPGLPTDKAEKLKLLSNPNLSGKLVQQLFDDPDLEVAELAQLHLAWSGEATQSSLAGGSAQTWEKALNQRFTLMNWSLTQKEYDELAALTEMRPWVRKLVSDSHPTLVEPAGNGHGLDGAFKPASREQRQSMAANSSISFELLSLLMGDIDPAVRDAARGQRAKSDYVLRLIENQSQRATNDCLEETDAILLARSCWPIVRAELARNKNLPAPVVEQLVSDSDYRVSVIALANHQAAAPAPHLTEWLKDRANLDFVLTASALSQQELSSLNERNLLAKQDTESVPVDQGTDESSEDVPLTYMWNQTDSFDVGDRVALTNRSGLNKPLADRLLTDRDLRVAGSILEKPVAFSQEAMIQIVTEKHHYYSLWPKLAARRDLPPHIARNLASDLQYQANRHDPTLQSIVHALGHNPVSPPDLLQELLNRGATADSYSGGNIPEKLLTETLINVDWSKTPGADEERLLCQRLAMINTEHKALVEILSAAATSPSTNIRLAAAHHHCTPVLTLASLVQDAELQVRLALCDNPSTNEQTLLLLAESSDLAILEKLAQSATVTQAILVALASNEQTPESVLKAICSRNSLPPDLMDALAARNLDSVTIALSQRHDLPAHIQLKFVSEGTKQSVEALSCTLDLNEDAQLALINRADEACLLNLADNPSVSSTAQKVIAQDGGADVKRKLGSNPIIEEEVINDLSTDVPEVRFGLTLNPNLPAPVVESLSRDFNEIAGNLIFNDAAMPPESVVQFLSSDDPLVVETATRRMNWSLQHPISFWQQPRAEIQTEVAQMCRSENALVRMLALSLASEDTLKPLSINEDSPWTDRFGLADNFACPSVVLDLLAKDANRYVRAAAQRSLLLKEILSQARENSNA